MDIPSTPKTWLAGTGLAADDLNTHVRDPMSFLLNRPVARATPAGLVDGTHNVIPSGTWTKIVFNDTDADTDGFWASGTPTALTVPADAPDSWWTVGWSV